MWNISQRYGNGHWYTDERVNNWHFGKRRKVIRDNRWGENWQILVDADRLFVATQEPQGFYAANMIPAFWIAWRS